MNVADLIRLLVLSIIWGGSFLFMRIAVPEFGPQALILIRVGVAALVLAPILLVSPQRNELRKRWREFLILGLTAASFPFCMLALATISLEAGFTSLLNATTPICTAVVGVLWFGSRFGKTQYVGLFIGLLGVAVLSFDRMSFKEGGDGWAILAALIAPVSYGVAGNYTRHHFQDLPPRFVAAGSTFAATLLILPLGVWSWPETIPSTKAWVCALSLSILCTAIAYLIFFRIISSASAMATSTVTFLVPISAIVWGFLILNERLTAQVVTGMVITFFGTALVIEMIGRSKEQEPDSGDD